MIFFAGSWFIALLFGSLMAGLYLNEPYSSFAYARTLFDVVNLLVLAVSYIIIIRKVQRNPNSQDVAALQVERTLSITLSIVIGVSLLTILPWAIYKSLPQHIKEKQTYMSSTDIHNTLAVIDIFCQFPCESFCIRHTNAGVVGGGGGGQRNLEQH